MTRLARCVLPARSRRHAAAAAGLTAVIAAVLLGSAGQVVAVTAGRPGPAVHSSGAETARPAAWDQVPYQRAQLSVPPSWLVESPQQLWCGLPGTGMIFVGVGPGLPAGMGCKLADNLAWIRPAGQIPPWVRYRRPSKIIHGIAVYRLPSSAGSQLYLVPGLGVRIGMSGSLAGRVLATLTRSPLAVVLRPGPVSQVPVNWVWHRFGSVRFAVPRRWPVQRENQWATCGTGLVSGSLLLINATRPPAVLPCPFPIPTAATDQAEPGLTVVTGRYAAASVSQNFTRCQVRRRTRICLSSITGQGGFYGGVLIFSVAREHQHAAAYFLLGLAGPGIGARTIFDSIGLTSS